jgi:hypothetical protein
LKFSAQTDAIENIYYDMKEMFMRKFGRKYIHLSTGTLPIGVMDRTYGHRTLFVGDAAGFANPDGSPKVPGSKDELLQMGAKLTSGDVYGFAWGVAPISADTPGPSTTCSGRTAPTFLHRISRSAP